MYGDTVQILNFLKKEDFEAFLPTNSYIVLLIYIHFKNALLV